MPLPSWLTDIFSNLMSDWLSNTIYLAIVVIWIVAFIKCVMPLWHRRFVLNRGARRLRNDDGAENSETLLGRGDAQTYWKQYLANIGFTSGAYRGAADVEDYINEDTMINQPGKVPLAELAPGMMVTLGILGTFIGIVSGLSGFNIDDVDAMLKGIQTLVPGMHYAFLTSVVGVIGSLTITTVRMVVVGMTRNALNRFVTAYRKVTRTEVVDPLTQIAGYQQEQLAFMRVMAEALATRLPADIKAAMEETMQPVQQSLNNFIQATTQEQLRGLDRIVTRFVDHMNDALHDQFNQLAATIELTCDYQRRTREGVSETVEGIRKVSGDIAEIQRLSGQTLAKFDTYMNKLNMSQLQVDDGYIKIAQQAALMQENMQQQTQYYSRLAAYQEQLQTSMAQFQTAADAMMRTTVDNSASSTMALRQLSSDIGKSAETLSSAHQQFTAGIHKELEHTFDLFDENMAGITKQLSWVVASIKESVERLPAAFDAAGGRYTEQIDQLTMTLQRAQMTLDEAVVRMQRPEAKRGG